jgi:hypothetical protein
MCPSHDQAEQSFHRDIYKTKIRTHAELKSIFGTTK